MKPDSDEKRLNMLGFRHSRRRLNVFGAARFRLCPNLIKFAQI